MQKVCSDVASVSISEAEIKYVDGLRTDICCWKVVGRRMLRNVLE